MGIFLLLRRSRRPHESYHFISFLLPVNINDVAFSFKLIGHLCKTAVLKWNAYAKWRERERGGGGERERERERELAAHNDDGCFLNLDEKPEYNSTAERERGGGEGGRERERGREGKGGGRERERVHAMMTDAFLIWMKSRSTTVPLREREREREGGGREGKRGGGGERERERLRVHTSTPIHCAIACHHVHLEQRAQGKTTSRQFNADTNRPWVSWHKPNTALHCFLDLST